MENAIPSLAWFIALSPSERLEFVAQVVAGLKRIDPQFAAASNLWRRGKSARLVTAGGRQAAVHLMVADQRLLRALLSRVEAGTVDFEPGRAVGVDGEVPAMVASLGVGMLVVREMRGELMLAATTSPGVAVPVGLAVGHPSPFPPPGEGFIATLFEGQIHLVGGYLGLRRREIQAARCAKVTLGLMQVSPGLLLVGLRWPGLLVGWADLPFALAVEPPSRRRWPAPSVGGDAMVVASLVDLADNRVRALRTLRLSPTFGRELHRIMDEQMDSLEGYDRAAYVAEVDSVRRRLPTPADVGAVMTVVEVAQDA